MSSSTCFLKRAFRRSVIWAFPIVLIGLVSSGCSKNEPDASGSSTIFFQRPAQADTADTRRAYDHWKTTLVTRVGANGFRRVVRPDTPDGLANSTVSEGISYGMILAVYFDDQPLFDDLFQYSQHWADDTGLMAWYVDPTGSEACMGADDWSAATDSDIPRPRKLGSGGQSPTSPRPSP